MLKSCLVVLLFAVPGFVLADTAIDRVSDPGDYIGQGQTCAYDDDTADTSYARNYDNGIAVNIRNLPGESRFCWTVNIAVPGNAEQQQSAMKKPRVAG